MRNSHQQLTAACLMAMWAASASAQWTVVYLHPPGAGESMAYGVADGQQVGSVDGRAGLWTWTAASWAGLTIAGGDSWASGVSAGEQAGTASYRASLWNSTPASHTDLNPPGAAYSYANDVSGGQQVGFFGLTSQDPGRACLWTGTAASCVLLHPAGATSSEATGTDGTRQVGYAYISGSPRAGLWTGSPASWVNLTPTTHGVAWGIGDGQQVGYAGGQASIWTGSAASRVSLHPAGASWSVAYGVGAGQQVGYATMPGGDRASLWSGTPASWEDLDAVLPGSFTESQARGIWHDANFTYVVGWGRNTSPNRREALMWVKANCYPDCNADGALTVADFGCFQTKFVAADPYADCNADGQRTVADFGCFQTKFVAGCP